MKNPLKNIFRLTHLKVSLLISLFFALVILFITGPDNSLVLEESLYSMPTSKFMRTLEYRAFDQKFRVRGKVAPPKNVAIVAIDEKSITNYGRWPWPRTRMAELIGKLKAMGAKVIAMDIVFSEHDQLGVYGLMNDILQRLDQVPKSDADTAKLEEDLSGLDAATVKRVREEFAKVHKREQALGEFQEYLRQERERINADRILAESISKAGNVVLGYFFLTEEEIIGLKPEQYLDASTLENSKISVVMGVNDPEKAKRNFHAPSDYRGVRTNIKELVSDNVQQGFFNMLADGEDGIYRRAPLLIPLKNEIYPSLSLQAMRMYLSQKDQGQGVIMPKFLSEESGALATIHVNEENKSYDVSCDMQGHVLFNWYGPGNTIPTFSIYDVMEGKVLEENIRDKVILVGPTALAIADLRTTTFGDQFPGVEMQATLVSNIIENNYLNRSGYTLFAEVIGMVVFGTLVGTLIGRVSATMGFVAIITVLASLIAFDYYIVFLKWNTWMRPVFPLLGLFCVYIGVTLRGFIAEELERRKIKQAFNAYVNPSVVDQMLDQPDKFRLGGERKELSVFFSDIRGFTTMSETMQPEELVNFLNEYLTPMTDLVLSYDGTLDKYIGDAMMGFWGAPLQQPDHAERACNCALDMMAKLEQLRGEWEKRNLPLINVGLGINTGQMSVGNMGSKSRFSYTVMGDEVNLASRIEGLSKEYGCSIIVGSKTARKVQRQFVLRQLDRVRVKGKALGEDIFELMGRRETAGAEELLAIVEAYEKGLSCFWNRKWDEAEDAFRTVLTKKPNDKPSEIFLEQIAMFRREAPAEQWDGTRTMTHK